MSRLPFNLRTEDLVRIAHEGYREGEPPIAYTRSDDTGWERRMRPS